MNRPFFTWNLRLVLLLICALACTWPNLSSAQSVASLRRSAIVNAVASTRPSIVNIHGHKTVRSGSPYSDPGQRVKGMGTGIIIDPRGYILTNHHVVEGVRRINVSLFDGTATLARVIARDPVTDLAVIKIDLERRLPTIRIGTSRDLMVGEDVIVIGNAFGYENSVTRGIISALHRSVQVNDTQKYYDLIQADASINPGNSGGPLLNIAGEVVGINVAVRVGAQGIGFAIPIDKAMSVAAQLLNANRISGVWHGIISDTEKDTPEEGVATLSVQDGSPAAVAGLSRGDVITKVNGVTVHRSLDVERALIGTKPGQRVAVQITRSGKSMDLGVELTSSSQIRQATAVVSIDEEAWEKLGMRLVELTPTEMSEYKQEVEEKGTKSYKFDGGLRVSDVRSGSAAAEQGIRSGDVLVGLHKWKTLSFDNVSYILRESTITKDQEVTFYIVRSGETFLGKLPATWVR
ncbi:MAG: trypsin-like peptidase domain-containing protein [Planctomycetales bacterium]|nr:trypsin-like peptidase domain-containing protein [Planctomycetales bacterium]